MKAYCGFRVQDVRVEMGQPLAFACPDGEMAECRFLLPLAFCINLGPVFVSWLGKVEIFRSRVMRAVARERPIARALYNFDIGVFLRKSSAGPFPGSRLRCRNGQALLCALLAAG